MSETAPGEGTLMVNPLLNKATAYFLLRPFFQPKKAPIEAYGSAFLDSDNWKLEEQPSAVLQGAVPSNCQELNATMHPHLDLEHTMVHVPSIRPGDYVAWHCDSKRSPRSESATSSLTAQTSDTRRGQSPFRQSRFQRHVHTCLSTDRGQRQVSGTAARSFL